MNRNLKAGVKNYKTAVIAVSLMTAAFVAGEVQTGELQAAAKKPVLAAKSGKLLVGTSKTVKIKNIKKKNVKKLIIKSSNKKVAKAAKAGSGKKTAVKITVKKTGNARVTAKLTLKNKKKYKLVYKVTSIKELTKKVPVFRKKKTKEKAKLRFYSDLPHVAYMDISDYYKLFFPKRKIDVKQSETDKNIYTMTSPTGSATVDVAKDTFYSEKFPAVLSLKDSEPDLDVNNYAEWISYVRCVRTEILKAGSPVTLDCGKYHIDLKAENGKLYFPVATLSDMYSDTSQRHAFYSGKKIYVDEESYQNTAGERDEADFSDAILDNMTQRKKRSDLTEFNYHELMFSLDYFWGNDRESTPLYPLVKEKGSVSEALDAYEVDGKQVGKKVKKLLVSSDPGEYLVGMRLLESFLYDGGHTYMWLDIPEPDGDKRPDSIDAARKAALKRYPDLNTIYKKYVDAYNHKFFDIYPARKTQRDNSYGLDPSKEGRSTDKSKYVEKGDTAVCVLDTFYNSYNTLKVMEEYVHQPQESRTLPEISEELCEPTVQFLDALKRASSNPNIKNFVLDISNNEGGYLYPALAMLSLMKDDSFSYSIMKNTLTGETIKSYFKVDRNFDGVFDEKDDAVDYSKRFRFAVVTSDGSFSCGNIFAALARRANIPILGERSGGGAGANKNMSLADGQFYMLSSYRAMVIDDSGEKTIEAGIPVDIDLLPKNDDGSVKMIDVKISNPETWEKNTVNVPDYSAFYDIDRLSAEIEAWYKKQ